MTLGDKRIRVLIVDDSPFMRKVMQTLIAEDPTFQVVGEAADGREAVALAESLRPDVISMDIKMPHVDGLEATEIIMAQNPRPILIVSSESRAGAEGTLRALELGAVDFVSKPSGPIDLDMGVVRDEFRRKLKMAAKVRVVRNAGRAVAPRTEPAPKIHRPEEPVAAQPKPIPTSTATTANEQWPLVILTASTGGPAALMKIIPRLRRDLPATLVLALHMPASFTSQFAQQLDEVSEIGVKEAQTAEPLRRGMLYLCPGSHHLRISGQGLIQLDNGERIGGYRPCADVAMETAAAWAGPMTVGVILTGMGNDGARGAVAVKAAGGYLIAQDESSSMIFGMPQEAIRTGVVDEITGVDNIPAAIEKRVLYLRGALKVGVL
jgi:two-component system chemotaxis response regulator CheB